MRTVPSVWVIFEKKSPFAQVWLVHCGLTDPTEFHRTGIVRVLAAQNQRTQTRGIIMSDKEVWQLNVEQLRQWTNSGCSVDWRQK